MDFYNYFSFSAKRAIYRASEHCQQFNNQYLEPEHIFYAILNLHSCSAAKVLRETQANLPKLTYSIEAYLYERAGNYRGQASFGARTLALLDEAFKEVKRLRQREIGTFHLLLALAKERSVFLRTLFTEHGLNQQYLESAYQEQLAGYWLAGEARKGMQQVSSAQANFPMSEAFDARCREVIKDAMYFAAVLKNPGAEPEHLLYCIVNRRVGGEFEPDTNRNYDVRGVLEYLLERIGWLNPVVEEVRSGLSARTENILRLALRWAWEDGQPNVGFPYLLAALASSIGRKQAGELKKLGLIIPDGGIPGRMKGRAVFEQGLAAQEDNGQAADEPEDDGSDEPPDEMAVPANS